MKWIILIITILLVIAGCTVSTAPPSEPASTDDSLTKESTGRTYISARQTTCRKIISMTDDINLLCKDGKQPFFDDTGCGCDPIDSELPQAEGRAEEVKVEETEEEEEVQIEKTEEEDQVEENIENEVEEETEEDASTECYAEQRDVDACIQIYAPVCGWSDESIQCITYPCASTYSNSCFACQNKDVSHWTPGECPAPGSAPQ